MRFTEHELTAGVTAAAKVVARGKWDRLSKIDRYHLLDRVGGQVLPVLIALPDVEVQPGTKPTFTDAQVRGTIDGVAGESSGGWLRRKAAATAQVALVRTALDAMPVRQDPDALIVPDHLD